ncbi:serine/threonine protein kinase [Micromonospora pattaloongensis]|uniref:non-specific serine/threonine protein kinase n=1 Tax=Micromonospora pattaloongensis TaxID=405436 RepID=A0A1H3MUL2_9ACTN|nr:serine/threonine-protein kinase [Micromonospora pattaloongensis]SDY79679.1 serine/threonine protein kinase [Micromonospora pattaloongensis]
MGGVDSGAELLGERYRLVERLGTGGMSVVWRGYDEVLGRQVAIKVLAPRLASDRVFRQRLRVEAQAAARLCHPHITNVYDYGETVIDGAPVPYVVMELIDGLSLATRLGRDGALPWRDAAVACAEVASALAAAHSRGVVHRDVTPANVMLTSAGAKVVDFGISALVGESDVGPDGNLLGTPAYLAPERLNAGQVSTATDVYALGLLLYRALTGRLPWQAASVTQMLHAHLHADPGPLPPVPGLPLEVAELCRRCLAKHPADRPTSAQVARTLADAAGVAVLLPGSPLPVAGRPPAEAAAGTTILPWTTSTDAIPLRTRRRARNSSRPSWVRRRMQAVTVGVGVMLVAGLLWTVSGRTPANGGEQAQAAPPGMGAAAQPSVPCRVRYALRKDSGSGFEAAVTVTNTGRAPMTDWQLDFDFPGTQTVTGSDQAQWEQRERTVTLRPTAGDPLAANGSVTLALAGAYRGSNPLPVEFDLDGRACAVEVAGVAGTPAPKGGVAAGSRAASKPAPITQQPAPQRKAGPDDDRDKKPKKPEGKHGKGRGDRD